MAVNIDNITAGLNKVQNITDNFSTVSHFEQIPIENIYPAKFNPYNETDNQTNTRELADSIRNNGLLHPITVNKVSDTRFEIISGEHRFNAISIYLHWKTIPCTVFDNLSETEASLKLHLANLETREYTPAQKLKFYSSVEQLVQQAINNNEFQGSKQQAIANILQISTRQVRKYKQILKTADEDTISKIEAGELSIEKAAQQATQSKEKKTNYSEALDTIDNIINKEYQKTVDTATPTKAIKTIVKKLYELAECELCDDVDRAVFGTFIDQLSEIADKYELEVKIV